MFQNNTNVIINNIIDNIINDIIEKNTDDVLQIEDLMKNMNIEKNYNENHSKSILKIQKTWRKHKNNTNINNFIHVLKNRIHKNNDYYNKIFIKCLKVYKLYPPSKNEYKFIFGGLIQSAIIELFDNIFYKCVDLDELHDYGSEYKNDCCLYLTNKIKFDLSIKAKSSKKGDIILVNKHGNNVVHNLQELITIVVVVDTCEIIIIPHNIVDEKFVKNNEANISYRSSLLTYLYKYRNDLIIPIHKNYEFLEFIKNQYNNIIPRNIYKELYSNL